MKFLWEELLWAFLCVPAVAALYVVLLRRRARHVVRYPGMELIGGALDATYRWRTHVPALLVLAAICAFLFAAARPVLVDPAQIGPRKLIVAVDVSYSMAAEDVRPSRLALAKEIAAAVVRWQPQDVQVGIVGFGANAYLVQTPTSERRRVLDRIESLELQAGSAIGTGLLASLMTVFPHASLGGGYDVFGREAPPWVYGPAEIGAGSPAVAPPASRPPGSHPFARILLLSDGYSTTGVPAAIAIARAAEHGVPVYTVGIGTIAGRIKPDMGAGTAAGFDEDTLLAMATQTKGRYWNGARMTDRAQLLQSIEGALRYRPHAAELGSYFSGLGALLLLAAAVISLAGAARIRP